MNVFSPGGLYSAQRHTGVDFTEAVVAAVERKLEHVAHKGRGAFRNAQLAVV